MSGVLELEQQLADSKKLIELSDLAQKLAKNVEFRKLILDELFTKEAARYVQQSVNPDISDDDRKIALEFAQATGHIKRWLSIQVQRGEHAKGNLPELERAIEQVRAEEDRGPSDEDEE